MKEKLGGNLSRLEFRTAQKKTDCPYEKQRKRTAVNLENINQFSVIGKIPSLF
jgi:hypothetical protein